MIATAGPDLSGSAFGLPVPSITTRVLETDRSVLETWARAKAQASSPVSEVRMRSMRVDDDARCWQAARPPGVRGRDAGQLSPSTASLATLDSEMNA